MSAAVEEVLSGPLKRGYMQYSPKTWDNPATVVNLRGTWTLTLKRNKFGQLQCLPRTSGRSTRTHTHTDAPQYKICVCVCVYNNMLHIDQSKVLNLMYINSENKLPYLLYLYVQRSNTKQNVCNTFQRALRKPIHICWGIKHLNRSRYESKWMNVLKVNEW